MQQSLLPLLLLAIITVCSTNELPFLTRLELEKIFEEHDNDNTDKLENIDDIMFKQHVNRPIKSRIYEEHDLDLNKFTNDNFRRVLEQRYLHGMEHFRVPKKVNNPNEIKIDANNDVIKRIKLIEDSLKNYEEVVTISPLLILKIRLSYLTNNMDNMSPKMYYSTSPLDTTKTKDDELKKIIRDEIISNDAKSDDDFEAESVSNNKNKKVVKKRIFSLWSRLQGLHRGHELHHRRHLHAFYGLPDDGGGGSDSTLTAETRATFLRPPGSPLRWG